MFIWSFYHCAYGWPTGRTYFTYGQLGRTFNWIRLVFLYYCIFRTWKSTRIRNLKSFWYSVVHFFSVFFSNLLHIFSGNCNKQGNEPFDIELLSSGKFWQILADFNFSEPKLITLLQMEMWWTPWMNII